MCVHCIPDCDCLVAGSSERQGIHNNTFFDWSGGTWSLDMVGNWFSKTQQAQKLCGTLPFARGGAGGG